MLEAVMASLEALEKQLEGPIEYQEHLHLRGNGRAHRFIFGCNRTPCLRGS